MSTESIIRPKKVRVRVDGNSREEYDIREELNGRNKVGGIEINGGEVEDNESLEVKNHQKTSKFQITCKSKK